MKYWIIKEVPIWIRCRSQRYYCFKDEVLFKNAGLTMNGRKLVDVVCFRTGIGWRPMDKEVRFIRSELGSDLRKATDQEAAMIMFGVLA